MARGRQPIGSNQAAQIDDYLKGKGSPMAGLGSLFVAAGKKYGVDPRLVVAISGIESSFGKHIYGAHNAWGWGPGKPFSNWEEGIAAVTGGLRRGYLDRGLKTPQQIVGRYAPASDGNNEGGWAKTVTQFMREMGAAVPDSAVPTTAPPSTSTTTTPSVTPPSIPQIPYRSFAGVQSAALQNLSNLAAGKKVNPLDMLSGLAQGAVADREAEMQAQAWGGTTVANDPSTPSPGKTGNADQGTNRAGGKIAKAIQIAKQQIGKPYKFGAAGPNLFDCSGLIEWSLEQAGIKTPGRLTTGSMMNMGRSVKGLPMEPGDWLVRHDGQQQHVVMYIGNGQVIAAPHTGEVVQYQDADRFTGAGWDVRRWP